MWRIVFAACNGSGILTLTHALRSSWQCVHWYTLTSRTVPGKSAVFSPGFVAPAVRMPSCNGYTCVANTCITEAQHPLHFPRSIDMYRRLKQQRNWSDLNSMRWRQHHSTCHCTSHTFGHIKMIACVIRKAFALIDSLNGQSVNIQSASRRNCLSLRHSIFFFPWIYRCIGREERRSAKSVWSLFTNTHKTIT